MMRKVLLVDDHIAIRMGLQEILTTAIPGLEFGGAVDYDSALRIALEQTWHLAIVDLDLPGGRSGLDLISSLHQAGSPIAALVYTMHAEDQFGIRALRAGARGYLSKTAAIDELVKAVQAILAGQLYVGSTLAALMADALVHNTPELNYEQLSGREFEVFRALAGGHPIVQIAGDLHLSPKNS